MVGLRLVRRRGGRRACDGAAEHAPLQARRSVHAGDRRAAGQGDDDRGPVVDRRCLRQGRGRRHRRRVPGPLDQEVVPPAGQVRTEPDRRDVPHRAGGRARPPMYAISNALAGPRTQVEGIVVHPEPTSWTIGKYVDVGEDLHLTTGTNVELAGAFSEVASQDRPGSETPNDLVHDSTTFTMTVIPEGNRLRIPWVFATEEPAGSGMDGATIKVAQAPTAPGRWPPRQCGRRHDQQRRPAPDHALRPGHSGPAVRRAGGPAPAGDGGAVGLRHLERRERQRAGDRGRPST